MAWRNEDQRLSKFGEVPTPVYRLALIRKSNGTLKLSDYFELFPVSSHTLSNYFLPYTPPPCRYTGRTAEITGDGGSSNSSLLFFHIVSWSTFSSDVMDCHKSLICRYLQMLVALQKKNISKICNSRIHLHKQKTPLNLWSTCVWARGGWRLGWHSQSCHAGP